MLGFCGWLIHGTRGFGSQIRKHLGLKNYLNFEANKEFSKMNNLQLRTLCAKMSNNWKNDRSYTSTFRTFLSQLDNEFFVTNNINPDSLINVVSRVAFQNKGLYLYFTVIPNV